MTLKHVSPAEAAELVGKGARLVDIREADEHAREAIPGALHEPLSRLSRVETDAPALIFHCKSGSRTALNRERLAGATGCEAYILDGGIEAWRAAGLPVRTDTKQPIELQRQVQITAGALILLGVLLAWLVAPGFVLLSAFVGAGLVFAGVSGSCAMARLLGVMPWNRRAARG